MGKGEKACAHLRRSDRYLRKTGFEETEKRLVKEVEDLLDWFRQEGKEKG
jgi:hypothetical protein